jgi:hypothetical protein
MLNKFRIMAIVSLLLTGFSILVPVTGSWTKNNVSMSGRHEVFYSGAFGKSIQGMSSAQTPRGVIVRIEVVLVIDDRCGANLPWLTIASKNKVAHNAYTSGSISANGNIQDCPPQTAHTYRNRSWHAFQDAAFGINNTYSLSSDR